MWNKCVFITRLQTYWCTHTVHKSIFNNRLHTQGIYKKKKKNSQRISDCLSTITDILEISKVKKCSKVSLDTVTILCKNIIFCPLFGLGCEAKHYCCNYREIGVRFFIVYKIIASFFQFLKNILAKNALNKKVKNTVYSFVVTSLFQSLYISIQYRYKFYIIRDLFNAWDSCMIYINICWSRFELM